MTASGEIVIAPNKISGVETTKGIVTAFGLMVVVPPATDMEGAGTINGIITGSGEIVRTCVMLTV